MKKVIIFDLYGTLIDIHTDEYINIFWESVRLCFSKYKEYPTAESLQKAYLDACAKLSLKADEIDIIDAFKIIYPKRTEKEYIEIAWIFRQCSTVYIRKYYGVDTLLQYLKENGFKIYLLSNAQSSFTRPELDNLELTPYFDDIFISSELGVKKPNPKFLTALLDKHNINVEEAVMIGNDYEADIIPAKALGLSAIYLETNLSVRTPKVKKIRGFNARKIIRTIKGM